MKNKKSKQKHTVRRKRNNGSKKPINIEQNAFSDLLIYSIILLVGIIIYSNSFNCSFHLDDYNNILNNPAIKSLDLLTLWENGKTRFVAYLSFALNYHFGELDEWGYHFVNLCIHLINAFLVYWLSLLIFSTPGMKTSKIRDGKKIVSLLTALLFVSHPLATQSVTYIIQRMASLVALFYLLSIVLYLKGRIWNQNKTLKYIFYIGASIAGILAMLTKQNAFTLPFAIVLIEFCFLQTRGLTVSIKNPRILLVIATLIGFITLIFTWFSFSIFDTIPPSVGHSYTVTPTNYLFTQFSVILKYIQLLILPLNLNLDYDFPISNGFFEVKTLFSFLCLLFLLVFATLQFKKKRVFSFCIFWFFLTISIESSIIPLSDLIFEHRTYLPSYGFFLFISSSIYVLLWKKYKYIAVSILFLMIGTNSILTYERNKIWKTELSLWNDVVAKSPKKARPLVIRGKAYRKSNQVDKALVDYNKAIEINPNYMLAYLNRGVVYTDLKEYEKAIADYTKVIEYSNSFAKGFHNRGVSYFLYNQLENALIDLNKAIELDPNYAEAYYNRGNVYSKLKQWNNAINSFTSAIELNPNYSEAYCNRGIVHGELQQWKKSLSDFSKAIEINPKNSAALSNIEIARINANNSN